ITARSAIAYSNVKLSQPAPLQPSSSIRVANISTTEISRCHSPITDRHTRHTNHNPINTLFNSPINIINNINNINNNNNNNINNNININNINNLINIIKRNLWARRKFSPLAMFDFVGREEDELSFKVGDIINVLEYSDVDDWWRGTLGKNSGIFPSNYVQEVTHQHIPLVNVIARVQAKWDFTSKDEGDLSFKAGDTINVIEY
ncbi:hypothetical protein BGZ52_009345, partial [Haplosporangium bisporale]